MNIYLCPCCKTGRLRKVYREEYQECVKCDISISEEHIQDEFVEVGEIEGHKVFAKE